MAMTTRPTTLNLLLGDEEVEGAADCWPEVVTGSLEALSTSAMAAPTPSTVFWVAYGRSRGVACSRERTASKDVYLGMSGRNPVASVVLLQNTESCLFCWLIRRQMVLLLLPGHTSLPGPLQTRSLREP